MPETVPVALNEVGLLPVLRNYNNDFNDVYKIFIELEIEVPNERLPVALELPIFRVVQEGLINIAKHTQTILRWIHLNLTEEHAITMSIHDNGQGFDPLILPSVIRSGHLGLNQIQELVEEFDSTLQVVSLPGHGTQIRACFPIEQE